MHVAHTGWDRKMRSLGDALASSWISDLPAAESGPRHVTARIALPCLVFAAVLCFLFLSYPSHQARSLCAPNRSKLVNIGGRSNFKEQSKAISF